jgi:hypothetical protein
MLILSTSSYSYFGNFPDLVGADTAIFSRIAARMPVSIVEDEKGPGSIFPISVTSLGVQTPVTA